MNQPTESHTTSKALPKPLLILLTILFFGTLQTVEGRPPPDGDQGNGNTAEGNGALFSLTTGTNNTADGFQALFSNTSGGANSATGAQALFSNTTASANTADGFLALFSNTTGAANTALGSQALNFSTVGNENTAAGNNALFSNTTGNDNTATGANAGHHNTIGAFNTVSGATALYFNTSGSFNTAAGSFALNLSTGNGNIALGYAAGINLTNGDANIDIGNQGVAGESGTIRIGTQGSHIATYIAGINGATVVGTNVLIDANGQLGTVLSSHRFKEEIKPMDKASESILALKPVVFRYKHDLDPNGTAQFGLVAEDVEKVNPALVVRDAEGKVYSVRYDAVNAMLLNEFLKQHRKVEEQNATITQLKSTVAQQEKSLQATIAQQQEEIKTLAATLKEQSTQIQKVKAQVEMSKSASQLVENQ